MKRVRKSRNESRDNETVFNNKRFIATMDDETVTNFDSWFNTTLALLNESYQLDLRRILSPETCELVHALCDFYMYDEIGLFSHLIAVCSHYLTSTSFVYADNQLKHKLNLHILLVVRSGRYCWTKKSRKQIAFLSSNQRRVENFPMNHFFSRSFPYSKGKQRHRQKNFCLLSSF